MLSSADVVSHHGDGVSEGVVSRDLEFEVEAAVIEGTVVPADDHI